MMYCPQCGKPNEDNVQFCAECGASMTAATSQDYGQAPVETEQYYSPPADDDFEIPQSKINHPLYFKIKGYIFYFIAACFLYTLFVVVSVEGSKHDRRNILEDRSVIEASFSFSGFQLLVGNLPTFKWVEKSDGEIDSQITNDKLNSSGAKDKLLRTPLFFRMPYYFLIIGLGLYAFGVFSQDRRKGFIWGSIGKVIAFISAVSIVWIFNDFENWADQARAVGGSRAAISVDSSGSLGLWGLILALGFLVVDYMISNLGNLPGMVKNIEIKKLENA